MKNNQNKKPKKILILIYKGMQHKFSTELSNLVSLFYAEVCSYLNLNPKKSSLYYNSKLLSLKNLDQKIIDIIKVNPRANFQIIEKKNKTLNLRYQTLDEIDINNNNNGIQKFKICLSKRNMNKLITMQNSERNILKLKLKNDTIKNKESVGAIISNYNTVKDIEKIMENFNDNNIQYPQKKGIIINTGNNTLRVEFNNEEHLNEFISYISFIKYENPLYKSILIKKDSNNIIKKDNKIFLNNNISFLNSIKKRNYKKNNKNISLSKSASSRSQ